MAVGSANTFEVLRLTEPLNFWAGLDIATGEIVDRQHPQHGQRVTGKALVLPPGEGSSSNTSVLVETVRVGTAPGVVIIQQHDPIVEVAAAVAREIYGHGLDVLIVSRQTYEELQTGASFVRPVERAASEE
jgi:predicted aconitase with swiveling domain